MNADDLDYETPMTIERAREIEEDAGSTVNEEAIHRALGVALDEVDRLEMEIAELRATLAAEQGRPEGAPSSDWVWWEEHSKWWAPGRLVKRDGAGKWLWALGLGKRYDHAVVHGGPESSAFQAFRALAACEQVHK